jgi:biotin carboxyl carrier protein
LVTPSSQIIGVQAVMNVLQGRYKMVSDQVRDYCYGLYGKPPAEFNPEVRKEVLRGYEKGETPIEGRPGDYLEPEMPAAREKVKELLGIDDPEIGDVILYAIFPRTGETFLKWKHGLSERKPGEEPKSIKTIKEEDELIRKVKAGEITNETLEFAQKYLEKGREAAPPSFGTKVFSVNVENEFFSVTVTDEGGIPMVQDLTARVPTDNVYMETPKPQVPQRAHRPTGRPTQGAAPKPAAEKPAPAPAAAEGETAIPSPMPGTVIKYLVAVGDAVKEGDSVVILEAMKMENAVPSPASGTVKSLGPDAGSNVVKGETLVVIG